jgi:hypothetical protein
MPAEVVVWLECPGCGHLWVAAIILPGAWFSAGSTPAKVAGRCYCPRCEHLPPMRVADAGVIERLGGLER